MDKRAAAIQEIEAKLLEIFDRQSRERLKMAEYLIWKIRDRDNIIETIV